MLSVCPNSHTMQVTMPKNNVTRFRSLNAKATDSILFGKNPFDRIEGFANNNTALGLTGALSLLLFCIAMGKAIIENRNKDNNAPV